MRLSAPELLDADLDAGSRSALGHNRQDASRAYVVTDGQRAVGYCALADSGIVVTDAPAGSGPT